MSSLLRRFWRTLRGLRRLPVPGGIIPPDKLRRIAALVRKETYQLVRDPGTLVIGVVMPVMLVVVFGYGLSLDVKNVPVAVVRQSLSEDAKDLLARFALSPYFDAHYVSSMHEAKQLVVNHKVDAIVHLQPDFSRRLAAGDAELQLLVNATDANTARIIEAYARGVLATWHAWLVARGHAVPKVGVRVESRLWFNATGNSRYFLVPGLIVLVMTLLGAFMTALVMAREWERGTFESLFVTPVRADEILIGKIIPYFLLGLVGLMLSVGGSLLLFHVPLRGSILVVVLVSMVYLLVTLGIGLVISSLTKNQFVASQMALIVTFLPALMLSGFIFDIHSMPAVVRAVTWLVPARYYVALLQTLFLAGDVWSVIWRNTAVLAVMAVIMLSLARAVTKKRLG